MLAKRYLPYATVPYLSGASPSQQMGTSTDAYICNLGRCILF
jgi:hypothetical protein